MLGVCHLGEDGSCFSRLGSSALVIVSAVAGGWCVGVCAGVAVETRPAVVAGIVTGVVAGVGTGVVAGVTVYCVPGSAVTKVLVSLVAAPWLPCSVSLDSSVERSCPSGMRT